MSDATKLQRYDIKWVGSGFHGSNELVKDDLGDYCRHSDVAALEAENERLRTALEDELSRLKKVINGRTHIMGIECTHPACHAVKRIRAALKGASQ